MRELTYKGFLKSYVNELSVHGTNNIYTLVREIEEGNLRLKEPLFLYAGQSGKMDELLAAAKHTPLYDEYLRLNGEKELPERYSRVFASFCAKRDHHKNKDEVKSLIREKILRFQAEKKISNYRIYSDLHMNHGNVNAWLKYGTTNKVSLKAAREILEFVEKQ